jgi:uncharacterized membrane protein
MKYIGGNFRVIIAIVLLISAIVVLAVLIFRPQPIQIVLETGQEVASKSSDYFSVSTVVVLLVCAFLIGAAITYLFYNSEDKAKKILDGKPVEKRKNELENSEVYNKLIPLLRDDEKRVVHMICEHKGEILQNELVLKLGLSKVKTTRILASLERKEIIERRRHGMTNKVKFKDM